jgi:hypothetical protein
LLWTSFPLKKSTSQLRPQLELSTACLRTDVLQGWQNQSSSHSMLTKLCLAILAW